MTTEDREYYAGHVMDRVNQIQLAVIGIGIAMLAINYLGLVKANYLLAWFDPWVGAGGFLLVLSCLFLVQGSRWLRA